MKYRLLGKTGLQVSPLCLGTMTFGDGADADMSKQIYQKARDHGVNFFDCANGYANGQSEEILGQLIKAHRNEVVIASKVYYPTGTDINARGLSRFHLTKALHASLERLNTEYIDVYYLHHFDEQTDLLETMSTLNDFVRQGKIHYIGISNFAAWQVMKAIAITKEHLLAPVACIQPMYNLLKRQAESEILPMAKGEQLGVFSYSPLAGGLLTGKYLLEKNDTSRFDTNTMYQQRYQNQTNREMVRSFVDFAKENNYNPVSMAIAWVSAHQSITAPIIGARNLEQLKPALDSMQFPMDQKLREVLDGFTLDPALATDREEERTRV